MSFLTPWWLAGLATFLLPLILHLRRQIKMERIKIGSIRFLPAQARPPLRSWRLRELLLLLLRLSVLLLLFGWLARPVHWPAPRPITADWLLFSPGSWPLQKTDPGYLRATALLQAGYQPHLLAPGFPRAFTAEKPSSLDLWSLLAEADLTLSPAAHLAVCSTPFLDQLHGSRPTLHHSIEWLPGNIPLPQSWLARLQPSPDGQWQVATGHSRTTSTSYQWQTQPASSARASGSTLHASSSPRPLHFLLVLDPGQEIEAHYLTAALQTALSATGGAASIEQTSPARTSPSDFLVWLSDQPMPSRVSSSSILLALAPTREMQTVSTELPPEHLFIRQLSLSSTSGRPIWSTSSGLPLLTFEKSGAARLYRLRTRFLPAASDLCDSGFFVEWLIADLFPSIPHLFDRTASAPGREIRTVSPAEALPATASSSLSHLPLQPINLQFLLGLLLALAFLAERWVAFSSNPLRIK